MRSVVRLSLASLAALAGGILVASCQVEPYCFDCVDDTIDSGSIDAGDSGRSDAGDASTTRDSAADTNPPDAWIPPDGCTVGAPELCNHFDDDCDTLIDEGIVTDTDVDNCGSCGHRCLYAHAFGECSGGNCSMGACSVGYYDQNGDTTDGCEYHCVATGDETCDRRDNDCDGTTDEGFTLDSDPMNCGICGRICNLAHTTASTCTAGACTIGGCLAGFVDRDGVSQNGCEYACTPTGVETCNRVDDDCDGTIDEGDPGSGGSCGSSQGICTPGTLHCVGGGLVCQGGVSPGVESCNNLDDDCDGTIDDGNPGGGPACGSSVGACLPGRLTCQGGALACVGAVDARTETCNGIDDDCDGTVDNGNPGGGASCGMTQGRCVAGTTMCSGGTLSCAGSIGPALETCNSVDDDCNGVVDDGFDLLHDVRNCGSCGNACSFPNAFAQCVPTLVGGRMVGTCQIAACQPGYTNLDNSPTNTNGCEYMCTRTSGTETCNGRDDNCNGQTDENVTAPTGFCLSRGVCSTTVPICRGAAGFTCTYPSADASGRNGYEVSEVTCDGADNDCDGLTDEPFPTLGQACDNNGIGQCFHTGTIVCGSTAPYRSVVCNAAAGVAMAETCNGIDDDCNMMVDDTPSGRGDWTRIRPAGGPASGANDFWIMTYEASRPNATATSAGSSSARACSEPNRIPWTSIRPTDAQTACAAVGGTLCTEAQWQRACESSSTTGSSATCTWSESTTCTTYSSTTCNGVDYDTNTTLAGNQDGLIPTGASGSTCYTPWSFTYTGSSGTVTSTGSVFDMSGNAQEWTAPRAGTTYPERGGSYNDISGGMTCQFNFEVADSTVSLPNVGFRCCRTTDPSIP